MSRVSDGDAMTVDYVMVEFPVGRSDFDREVAREVKALISAEFIRVLDVLVLDKDDRGTVTAVELEDLGIEGSLAALSGHLAEILAEDDVSDLAHAMENGTMAGVLVWENVWASALLEAARTSGAHLIASGRISPQAILDPHEAGWGRN